jgi:uncharacterized membrane protein
LKPSLAPAARTPKERLWEIDALRGIAIVAMVYYHFVWDLNYFGLIQQTLVVGPWQWFARSIATTFIFVMGISLTLSYTYEQKRAGHNRLFAKYLWRGAKIFGLGLIVTIATYFFIGRGFVIFGILHLLGASIVLAYPFLKVNRWVSLVAGIMVIFAGIYVDGLRSDSPWFIWLGIKQYGIYMVDYYPILPWYGLSLIGIFAGYTLYPGGRRTFSMPDWSDTSPVRALTFLGRHSLLIYIVHQPILIGFLMLLT